MTSGYLLDTNHLGVAVDVDSPVRRRVKELRLEGTKVGTSVAVLCRQMNLTLATTDRDFEALADINVEDWTK